MMVTQQKELLGREEGRGKVKKESENENKKGEEGREREDKRKKNRTEPLSKVVSLCELSLVFPVFCFVCS